MRPTFPPTTMLLCRAFRTTPEPRCQGHATRPPVTDRQPWLVTDLKPRSIRVTVGSAANRRQMTGIVTEADLARARKDPVFRHQLVADSLDLLLRELNRLRQSTTDATRAPQIREGVDLAVRLADLLQRIAVDKAGAPHVALPGVAATGQLAFSAKIPITRASARPRLGAERTAVWPLATQQDRWSGVRCSRLLSIRAFPERLEGLRAGTGTILGKASACRFTNTSS